MRSVSKQASAMRSLKLSREQRPVITLAMLAQPAVNSPGIAGSLDLVSLSKRLLAEWEIRTRLF